jgi:IS30 family transposase
LNGLIRQYITKKSDFNEFTNLEIKEIETKINCRTRIRYGFENPIFVMNKLLFNPKVAFVA